MIAGTSADHAFIQIITNTDSYYFRDFSPVYRKRGTLYLGGNTFSKDGLDIHIDDHAVSIHGCIRYADLTPLRYDIMGPFKFFPMQCRHKIISLLHRLEGSLSINGEVIDFTGGTGYIEGDSGTSFPDNYMWIQCNDFYERVCISVSLADVPFAGTQFQGCIGVVYLNGVEYRMATYRGVKVLFCNENRIILKQGNLGLDISIGPGTGHALAAPKNGDMCRAIQERIVCGARFLFTKNSEKLFDQYSKNASFECVKKGVHWQNAHI